MGATGGWRAEAVARCDDGAGRNGRGEDGGELATLLTWWRLALARRQSSQGRRRALKEEGCAGSELTRTTHSDGGGICRGKKTEMIIRSKKECLLID